MIAEYGIGFNSKGELVVIEFNRTTGKTSFLPLVVKGDKIVREIERICFLEEHTMEEFMYGQEGNPNDGSM